MCVRALFANLFDIMCFDLQINISNIHIYSSNRRTHSLSHTRYTDYCLHSPQYSLRQVQSINMVCLVSFHLFEFMIPCIRYRSSTLIFVSLLQIDRNADSWEDWWDICLSVRENDNNHRSVPFVCFVFLPTITLISRSNTSSAIRLTRNGWEIFSSHSNVVLPVCVASKIDRVWLLTTWFSCWCDWWYPHPVQRRTIHFRRDDDDAFGCCCWCLRGRKKKKTTTTSVWREHPQRRSSFIIYLSSSASTLPLLLFFHIPLYRRRRRCRRRPLLLLLFRSSFRLESNHFTSTSLVMFVVHLSFPTFRRRLFA